MTFLFFHKRWNKFAQRKMSQVGFCVFNWESNHFWHQNAKMIDNVQSCSAYKKRPACMWVSVNTSMNAEYKPFKIDSTTKQRIPFPLLIRSLWGQPGDWHCPENPAFGPSQLQNSEKEEIRAGRKRSGRLSRVLIDSQSNFSRFPMIERQDKRGTCFSQTCPKIFRPRKKLVKMYN